MSPLKINMLLHYYAFTNDYRARYAVSEPEHASSIAVGGALQHMVDDGLLACEFGDIHWATGQNPANFKKPLFSITEKGRAMVDHLMAVQIPVCNWVQPSKREAA